MKRESQYKSQIANLQAQNARIVKENEALEEQIETLAIEDDKLNGQLMKDIADLQAELEKHKWIGVEKAGIGVKYQLFRNDIYRGIGQKAPSERWFCDGGWPRHTPDLIKPITLPPPKTAQPETEKWISVKDRLPPTELVCVRYLVCDNINMWVDAWVMKEASFFEWQDQRPVTHWKPITLSPPKADQPETP